MPGTSTSRPEVVQLTPAGRDLPDPRLRGGGGVGARAAERATKALQELERSR